MAISQVVRVEIVAPKDRAADLLGTLENIGKLHIDDIHDGLSDEDRAWEAEHRVDSRQVDERLAATRIVIDAFHRFAPVKTGLLEDFFSSPPAVSDEEFRNLTGSLDIVAYRDAVHTQVEEHDAVLSELQALRERIDAIEPWQELGVDLADVQDTSYATMTALRVPSNLVGQLSAELRTQAADALLQTVATRGKNTYAVVAALPGSQEGVRAALKGVRADEVELPQLHTSATEALASAQSRITELERRRDEIERELAAQAEQHRRVVLAISDDLEGRRRVLDAERRLFYSQHAAVVAAWTEVRDREQVEQRLAAELPDVRVRFTDPKPEDAPPVRLRNRKLVRPFETLVDMYGMPKYGGIDPTPFIAVAMTVFYAISLGDFGYGLMQVLLVLWLRKRYGAAGGTWLFLTMFLYMGVATLGVGVLTWSFFGFTPGATEAGKFLGFLPLINPTAAEDIIPLIGIAIGLGVVFQLASVFAGFLNLLKRGQIADAIFDNLAWFLLLLGAFAALAGVALDIVALLIAGAVLAAPGLLTVVLFSGRNVRNIVGRLLAGVFALYGIIGYYGFVGAFSDILSYMRLAILSMTSAFIAFVAEIIGNLLWGGEGVVLFIVGLIFGGLVFVFFHILNLVLSMLGSFVHSLRLNFLESFQRYYPEGGVQFTPLRREGRFFRFED